MKKASVDRGHSDERQALAVPTMKARKQQVVRDAIWDAAANLFAAKGFDETTVEDIAQTAGVSRRSFFRYFSSKNDLMAQGVVNYAADLGDAIEGCAPELGLAEVFRAAVLQVAQKTAAHPRTRKIMKIAAQYPAAREAQLSRMAELQDSVATAYARRKGKRLKDDPEPALLAALTLSVLSVIFRSWFEHGQGDIAPTVSKVLSTLDQLLGGEV
jgi:AcrR family transcriptional regulator